MIRSVHRADASPTLWPASGFDLPADPANPARPDFLQRLRKLLLRLGEIKSTLLITAITTSSSLCIAQLINLVFPPPMGREWLTLAMSAGIPFVVSPPVAWFVVLLLFEAETARRIAERLAVTDPLTRAYNRRYFFRIGERALARSLAESAPFSVLLLDIDHFKSVNDHHGHAAGDRVLKEVAQACRASMRRSDVLARFGGEEFVVLLHATDLAGASRLAENLRRAIEALAIPSSGARPIRPTVSIGVATVRASAASLDKILAQADQAMYLAKRGGRNRVVTDQQVA